MNNSVNETKMKLTLSIEDYTSIMQILYNTVNHMDGESINKDDVLRNIKLCCPFVCDCNIK